MLAVTLNSKYKMFKIVLTNFFLVIVTNIFCQIRDSTALRINYGSEIYEVQELFRLEQFDFFKISLNDKNLIDKYIILKTKEYWQGKLTKENFLVPAEYVKEFMNIPSFDTSFIFTLMTKPYVDSITFSYNYQGNLTRKYKRNSSSEYSLREAINSNGEYVLVPVNKYFPLFVYSMPYVDPKQPNYRFYCKLTANGVQPEDWWKVYKVEHYVIVEIKIVTSE